MIITCENCKTRFNLDENLIKESGSKVRCSRCQYIFTAYKPRLAEEHELGIELEEKTAHQAAHLAEPPQPIAEGDEAEAKAPEVSEEISEEPLDFDLFESERESAEEEISLEDFGLEEEPAAEETAQPTEQPAPEEELEEEIAPQEEKVAAKEETSLEDFDLFDLEKEPAAEEAPELTFEEVAPEEEPEQEFTQDLIIEEETPFEEAPTEAETAAEETEEAQQPEEEPVPPPIADRKPPARKPLSKPFLVLLIFVLVGGGGYAAHAVLKSLDIEIPFKIPFKIPFLESLTGGEKSETIDPGNMHITLLEQLITDQFVDNTTVGRLFVIKGKIRSDYPAARNFIRVKGILYLKDGKIAQDRIVYCSNVLSDTELQTLDKPVINKKLGNRFGDNKSNFRVPSGKVLPFMIVFTDLPQDLGEFSVEVVGSVPG